jgi:hypothetical protein
MNFFSTNLKQRQDLKNLSTSLKKRTKERSQMYKLLNKNSINVAIVNKNAYWVHNNTFYVAKVDEFGEVDTDNAKQIDVFSLSNRETKNLLKILDSLKER